MLKDVDTVFATVVKNDKVLKEDRDIMAQLELAMKHHQTPGLPPVKSIEDIYSVGSICEARIVEDKHNPF